MGERYTNIKVLDLETPLGSTNRIYLKSDILKALEEAPETILGYSTSRTTLEPNPEDASHQVEYVHVRGLEVFIDILVLDTPEGIKLQTLMDKNEPVKFRIAYEGLVENLEEETNNPIMSIIRIITFCYEEIWYDK